MKHPPCPYYWLDSIIPTRHSGWCLEGIKTGKGSESAVLVPPTEDLRNHLYFRTAWQDQTDVGFFGSVDIPDLAAGQRLINPKPVVRALYPGIQTSGRHALYRFDIEGEIYIFPALFFIAWLYLKRKFLASYLFRPGMLESHLDPSPVASEEEIIMHLAPSFQLNWLTGENARFMAWLALKEDARRGWGSVSENAIRNAIDLTLPHVSMEGRVGGVKVSGMNIVGWSREITFGYGFPQKNVRAIRGRRQIQLTAR